LLACFSSDKNIIRNEDNVKETTIGGRKKETRGKGRRKQHYKIALKHKVVQSLYIYE